VPSAITATQNSEVKRTTVNFPLELHQKLSIEAVLRRSTIQKIIVDAVRLYLPVKRTAGAAK